MASVLESALEYTRRGWALCAVYPVLDGACGCDRGSACKTPGKHPRGQGWQRAPRPATYWQRSRDNVGIITGARSGFWVLDFDPGAALDDGNVLASHLRAQVGQPHVQTGGHGWHWRFRLTPGHAVANGQNGVGALPAGFDVRGEGGMVVAAPSVSGKGAYVELADGVLDAPEWLYAAMAGARENGRNPDAQVGDQPREILPFEVQGTRKYGPGNPRPGADAYYTRSLLDECAEYAALTDQRRGDPPFSFGCSLVELWRGALVNGLAWSERFVYERYAGAMAAATANGGGGYGAHEVPYQWRRALEHVERTGEWREMQPEAEILPPFHEAPESPVPSSADAGTPELPAATDPERARWEYEVGREVYRRQVRDEGERRYEAIRFGPRPPLSAELISGDSLDQIADPVPLVEGMLFVDTLARINGRPGQGKSFVAVDLACSVATGVPWHGRAVKKGPVLYLAAEGLTGLKHRIRAWEEDRGRKVGTDLMLFPRAVQSIGPEWPEFVALVAAARPSLIVLDTQARVTAGVNENDAGALGEFVRALEALQHATGACVLVVHHAGKGGDGDAGRGSNAVEGAMVSEFSVSKAGMTVTVKTTRQKDVDPLKPITLTMKPVGESVVFSNDVMFVDAPMIDRSTERARALYIVMRDHFGGAGGMGGTRAQIDAHLKTDPSMAGLNMSSGQNGPKAILAAWRALIARGLVIKADKADRYRVLELDVAGPEGVLTPAVDVDGPDGWAVWCPEAASLATDKIPVPMAPRVGQGTKADG